MRIAFLSFALILTACGFQPMYGDQSVTNHASARAAMNDIDIAVIPDRSGQFLRNALIDRFYSGGYPADPTFELKVTPVRERIIDFDITIEDEATRRQIQLAANFTMVNNQTGETVLTRRVDAITSFNVLESEYSNIVTEQSARDAALNDLARKIERDIVLYLNRS